MSLHSESTPSHTCNDVSVSPDVYSFPSKACPVPLSHGQIKDLLCCNDPLAEAEKMALHLLVDEAPDTLANLDQQIIEMRQTLDSLIQKRQLVESDFNDAKTILHSIRSMPPDILKEIFAYCVPNWDEMISEPPSPGCDSLHPLWGPWMISHVSRTWRDISLSHPCLWTCIKLDFRKYGALSMRAVMTKVTLLLERSNGMDLFVALLSPMMSLSDHPAFALLDLSAPRWRKLIVYALRPCLRALSGTSFSRLQVLVVMANSTNQDDVHIPVNTFQTAPSLQFVSISSHETRDSFPLPWSRIETYDCNSPNRNQWEGLKKFTALKLLQIASLTHTPFDPSELPQITLPTVTSLRISEREHDLGGRIISKIIENNILLLPSLSALKIQFFRDNIPSFPLSHQLPNSLTTLIIRDAMESPDNTQRVLQFLETVPYINTLVIDGRRCSEFLEGLTIQPGKDVILPNLRILLFQGHRQPFPDPVILDFLESRCRRDGDDAGGVAVNEKDHDDCQSQWVFLEEIGLSKVELVP